MSSFEQLRRDKMADMFQVDTSTESGQIETDEMVENYLRNIKGYVPLSFYNVTSSAGPRYRHEEGYSGEEFREEVLEPAIRKGKQFVVDIDIPATSSFLEEAFGGIIRSMGIDAAQWIQVVSHAAPSRADKAIEFINAAIEKEVEKTSQVVFINKGGYRDGAIVESKMMYKPHLMKVNGILQRQSCKGPSMWTKSAWNKKEWTCNYCGELWTRHSTNLFGRESIWWPHDTPGMCRYGP